MFYYAIKHARAVAIPQQFARVYIAIEDYVMKLM